MSKSKLYKHPKYGHVYGETVATPLCRVAWPSLVLPKDPPPPTAGQPAGQPRYEVTLILDPKEPKVVEWLKAMKIVTKEMIAVYNEGKSAKLADCPTAKDGNEFDLEKYPYYKDMIIMQARNVAKPEVYNSDMQVAEANIITGGNIVKAVVTPLLTAHGVSYKLMKIRLVKDDGTKFAGGVNQAAITAMLADDDSAAGAAATAKLADEPEVVEEAEEEVVQPKVAKKGAKGRAVDIL